MNTQDQVQQLQTQLVQLRAQVAQTAEFQAQKDRLEQEYQRSQVRFRSIFEQSAIGKKIINNRLEIIQVNHALTKTLGYSQQELIGRNITDFAHPDYAAPWKLLQHELWTTDLATFNFDTCLIRKDGAEIWAHITTIQIDDEAGKLGYTILEDITERKELGRLKAALLEQEHRQRIAETILNTQEEERSRVAESLHHSLGQLLYGVKLNLARVNLDRADDAGNNNETIQYTKRLLDECMQECRRISHNLMPAVLAQEGLVPALKVLCRQASVGLACDCHIEGPAEQLEGFMKVAIYRIAQELFMNVVKHARATAARLNLIVNQLNIQLSVTDNGCGFAEKEKKASGIGLQAIRDKISLLNGNINIKTAKGNGTSIEILLPKRVN